MPPRTLIVHSGCGSGLFLKGDKRFSELRVAAEEGVTAMRRGSSLDGVETAVRYMEDCGQFNAGRGACLTAVGTVQLDAAIMEGKGLRGAGIGLCECTYNPVSLARVIMEKTDHVLIAGSQCSLFAKAAGLPTARLQPSLRAKKRFAALKVATRKEGRLDHAILRSIQEGSTVGAVAIDSEGVPAAAVSTGGTWMKLPGRIGDSAIIGAGIYADAASGAACATGIGEEIIKCSLCWNACQFLREGDALWAARKSIALINRRSGKSAAGIVAIDTKGRVGFAYNTEAMGRAWYDSARNRFMVRV